MKRLPFAPLWLGALTGILVALAMQVLPTYARFVAGELAVLVIITLGANLLLGVAGLLSVAGPAFVGIGANGMTILLLQLHLPFLLAIPLAVAFGWLVGLALGLVSLRVAGFYLAVVTFGFLNVFLVLLNEGGNLTGGGYGLIVPRIDWPWGARLTVDGVCALAVFFAVVTAFLTYALQRSRIGRAWIAIRENPVAAELQGIDLARLKTLAFAVSSAMATLAGCFQALLLGVTNPSSYSLNVSIAHLSYVVVGGMSAGVVGPILGPIVLFVIPEAFRAIGQYRELFYGSVLLLTLILAPHGIAGAWDRGAQFLRGRQKGARA